MDSIIHLLPNVSRADVAKLGDPKSIFTEQTLINMLSAGVHIELMESFPGFRYKHTTWQLKSIDFADVPNDINKMNLDSVCGVIIESFAKLIDGANVQLLDVRRLQHYGGFMQIDFIYR